MNRREMPAQYAAASHMRQARDEPYRSQPKISRGELARRVAQLHRTARELALNGATRQGKQRRGRQRKPAPPCDQARESAQMVRAQLQA